MAGTTVGGKGGENSEAKEETIEYSFPTEDQGNMTGIFSKFKFRHRSGRRGKMYRCLRSAGIITIVLSLLLFVIVPVVFRYTPSIQRYFIFLNSVSQDIDFSKPEDLGLLGTRNFYLESDDDIIIGVWHIVPESLIRSNPGGDLEKQRKWFEGTLRYDQPVILYSHGNKGSRGQGRRIDLYKKLQQMDYHVFAFDYRGYADSSPTTPTETGLVTDAKAVFKYLSKLTKTNLIFFWGHSLGTGVACHAVADLCQAGTCPAGLILESPFNNIEDEVRRNPMAWIFRGLPYFDWAFVNPLKEIDVQFKSDEHITQITSPIMILHAEDDIVVPFDLGQKLQEAGQATRPSDLPINLIKFDSKFRYGHNFISRAPELPSVVSNDVQVAE